MTKNSIWTTRRGKGNGEGETLTSFFFTEFPKLYEAKDMVKVFKEYGLVMEVFILATRDKQGKRYGFARFRKVLNERIMAEKLYSIHI
ncbi:unnamed protein product [Lathyrus sativus]|nr:unnamed protein product [Lathyrus sativus]